MKVMILTGRFGMGHYAASQSLAEQIQAILPGAEVPIVDLCESVLPDQAHLIYKAFEKLVNHLSLLFNLGYRYTAKFRPDSLWFLPKTFFSGLKTLLLEAKPDAVICTVPIAPMILAACRRELAMDFPFFTCITDLYCHPYWLHEDTNRYLVADEATKAALASRQIPAEKIVIFGIPVKNVFRDMPTRPTQPPGEVRRLLIMGGGLGLLGMPKAFYRSLDQMPLVKTTIITGSNQKLMKKLSGRYANIEVLGFTDEIAGYMRRSDLIISKAGGITVFESIYSELPMLLIEPLLAQEMGNAEFVVQRGIGRMLEKRTKARIREIEELIYDETALCVLRSQMRVLRDGLDKAAVGRLLAEMRQ